jgi:hypothetical protein
MHTICPDQHHHLCAMKSCKCVYTPINCENHLRGHTRSIIVVGSAPYSYANNLNSGSSEVPCLPFMADNTAPSGDGCGGREGDGTGK